MRPASKRRHRITIQQHNGTLDNAGNATLNTEADWETIVSNWPCEAMTASGGEKIRGRQTNAETTHVFIGEYYGASATTPDMRAVFNGSIYQINAVYDPDQMNRELRIEAQRRL